MGFYLYQGYKEYGKDMSENEMKKKNARNKRTESKKRYQRNTFDLSHRGAYQKPREQQKVNI